jgi:hypothetical protein
MVTLENSNHSSPILLSSKPVSDILLSMTKGKLISALPATDRTYRQGHA